MNPCPNARRLHAERRYLKGALLLVVLAALGGAPGAAGPAPASAGGAQGATGPAVAGRGALIIVGGGSLPEPVLRRFVDLAGGPGRARIVVLPMASSYAESGPEMVGEFHRLGAEATSLVLSRDEAGAAAGRLRGVSGVWFTGGDQSLLTAAIGGTPFEDELHRLHRGGAVVGGTSAGAAVMSRVMITGNERRPAEEHPEDDQTLAFLTIERDNIETSPGLGFLPGTIVDQHFVRRKRHNRLISAVLERPDLIGVGIDESTALEVGADGCWRILGEGAVIIYDARKARIEASGPLTAQGVLLHLLRAGGTFDPAAGGACRPRGEP